MNVYTACDHYICVYVRMDPRLARTLRDSIEASGFGSAEKYAAQTWWNMAAGDPGQTFLNGLRKLTQNLNGSSDPFKRNRHEIMNSLVR